MNTDSMTRAETILVNALQSLRHARGLIQSYPRIDGREEYIRAQSAYLKLSEELREDMASRTSTKIAYICSPINTPQFTQAAMEYALSIGLHIMSSSGNLRERIKCVADADMLILLDGWEESREARIESKLAFDLGIEVVPLHILKILMGHA